MKRFLKKKSEENTSSNSDNTGRPLLFFSCRELIKVGVDLLSECYSILAETRLRDLELGETANIAISAKSRPTEDIRQKMLRLSDILREIAQKCVE